MVAGRNIRLLIDSGASKNYIRPIEGLSGIVPAAKSFNVSSIHGSNIVTSKCYLSMFGVETQFFVLPQLSRFDGIIGLDLLKRVGAVVDLNREIIITNSGSEKLFFENCADVNFSCASSTPITMKDKLTATIKMYKSVFGEVDESLPFNTNVIANED